MVQEKKIVRLGLAVILFIALLGLVSTPAFANGRGRHHSHPRACSKTASAAFLACQNEVKDDYWIAQGNCYNLSDEEAQAECFEEAKEDYKDAREECRDQLEARKDLCDELGEAPYDPEIDPADFRPPATITTGNANPYFPLVRGNMWTYKNFDEDGEVTETITVEVTDETIMIEEVECVVVHDVVYEDDIDPTDADDLADAVIIEDTFDWYGQKIDGTVVYMGEFSLAKEDCETEDDPDGELCEGLFTEDGSWKSGYEGGKAGIIMFGDLSDKVGTVFRQELSLGNAEDAGEIISITASPIEEVDGFACGGTCVKTRDFTPIEPDMNEFKYYAPGVGVVLEINPDPEGPERVELVEFTTP